MREHGLEFGIEGGPPLLPLPLFAGRQSELKRASNQRELLVPGRRQKCGMNGRQTDIERLADRGGLIRAKSHFIVSHPRSGELRTQKLKSHLVRTQSLNVLPLKP